MVNRVTWGSLARRLERANKRNTKGPPYIDIDGQLIMHIKSLRDECRQIRRRKAPEYLLADIVAQKYFLRRQKRSLHVWLKLTHKVEFLKVANHDWVASYDAFVADIGLPPTPRSKLIKEARFIRYTGSTCYWWG